MPADITSGQRLTRAGHRAVPPPVRPSRARVFLRHSRTESRFHGRPRRRALPLRRGRRLPPYRHNNRPGLSGLWRFTAPDSANRRDSRYAARNVEVGITEQSGKLRRFGGYQASAHSSLMYVSLHHSPSQSQIPAPVTGHVGSTPTSSTCIPHPRGVPDRPRCHALGLSAVTTAWAKTQWTTVPSLRRSFCILRKRRGDAGRWPTTTQGRSRSY